MRLLHLEVETAALDAGVTVPAELALETALERQLRDSAAGRGCWAFLERSQDSTDIKQFRVLGPSPFAARIRRAVGLSSTEPSLWAARMLSSMHFWQSKLPQQSCLYCVICILCRGLDAWCKVSEQAPLQQQARQQMRRSRLSRSEGNRKASCGKSAACSVGAAGASSGRRWCVRCGLRNDCLQPSSVGFFILCSGSCGNGTQMIKPCCFNVLRMVKDDRGKRQTCYNVDGFFCVCQFLFQSWKWSAFGVSSPCSGLLSFSSPLQASANGKETSAGVRIVHETKGTAAEKGFLEVLKQVRN